MLFLLLLSMVSGQECPRDLYCSNLVNNCGTYCGGLSRSSIVTKQCIVNGPSLPYACACAPPVPSCTIPIYDACMNPAMSFSECNAQTHGSPTYNFVWNQASSNNCTVLDCIALSTNTIQLRVPTPAPPTFRPTFSSPTSTSPTSATPTSTTPTSATPTSADISNAVDKNFCMGVVLFFFGLVC